MMNSQPEDEARAVGNDVFIEYKCINTKLS